MFFVFCLDIIIGADVHKMKKAYRRELNVMEFCDTEDCEAHFIRMAMSIRTKSRRAVFHYILNNPGSSVREIMEDLRYTKSMVLIAIRSTKNADLVKVVFKRAYGKFFNILRKSALLNDF